MQLTNIARDVLEDAHKGRCYIPANWLAGIGCDEIINASDEHQLIVKQAIEKLLDMAEQYYSSASQGLIAIPRENRVAIAVAMLVYREIGVVLREQQYDYAKGRVFVSMPRKCLVALQAWWRFAGMEGVLPRHNQALHQAFSKRL
jgi:phytoene synthase